MVKSARWPSKRSLGPILIPGCIDVTEIRFLFVPESSLGLRKSVFQANAVMEKVEMAKVVEIVNRLNQ